MKDLEIYCITDKKINLSNKNYRIGWVGKEEPLVIIFNAIKIIIFFIKKKIIQNLLFNIGIGKIC